MIKIIKLTEEHLHEILVDQLMLKHYLTEEKIAAVAKEKDSYTAVNAYGKVLACGGLIHHWENRAEAWSILDQNSRKYFIHVHNEVKKFLDNCGVRRVEMYVHCEFENGHRWAKALGFKMEAPMMEAFEPNGQSCSLYAKVRVS